MKLSDNYTFADIPANRPFTFQGADIHKDTRGAYVWRGVPCILLISPDTDTGIPRDIKTLDASTIMASMGRVFLIKGDDGFYIEEYDETGTVHYAQYFTNAADAGRVFTKQSLGFLSQIL